jgi:hypothetical protein
MLIFITGLPVLWSMFPAAIVFGCVLALVLRFIRHRTPGAPWLLSAIETDAKLPPKRPCKQDGEKKAGPFAKVSVGHGPQRVPSMGPPQQARS